MRDLLVIPILLLISCASDESWRKGRIEDVEIAKAYVKEQQAESVRTAKKELIKTVDLRLGKHKTDLTKELKGILNTEEKEHKKEIKRIDIQAGALTQALANHIQGSNERMRKNREFVKTTIDGFDQRLAALWGQTLAMSIVDAKLTNKTTEDKKVLSSTETEAKRNSQDLVSMRAEIRRLKTNQDGFLGGKTVGERVDEQKQAEDNARDAKIKAAQAAKDAEAAMDTPLTIAVKGFAVTLLTVLTMILGQWLTGRKSKKVSSKK